MSPLPKLLGKHEFLENWRYDNHTLVKAVYELLLYMNCCPYFRRFLVELVEI
jgi:hypothetical protein